MKTGIILPLMAIMAAAGCTRQIPVAAPTWHSDVRNERSATTDTIYIGDSIHIATVADTVRETRVRTVYRTRTERDTLTVCVTDTVTTIVEVEKAPTRSQSTLTTIGRYATGILIGIALVAIVMRKR